MDYLLAIFGGIIMIAPFIVWSFVNFFEKKSSRTYFWKRNLLLIMTPICIVIGVVLILIDILVIL